MRVKAQKWGNSLAVRVPSHVARLAGLQVNDSLEAEVVQGKIVLTPAKSQPMRFELAELVSNIQPGNRYRETDFGVPRGHEVW